METTLPLSGLLLALASALGWSAFDALRKGLSAHADPALLGLWITAGQVPLLALWALLQAPPAFPPAALGPALVSVLLNTLALYLFLRALQASPMSLTIPLLSLTPVGATLLAWVGRGQAPTVFQGAGAILVVVGALTLGLKAGTWPGLGAFLSERGVWRMTCAALLWSATAVADQSAVAWGAGAWYAPLLAAGVGLGMFLLALERRAGFASGLQALRRRPWTTLGAIFAGSWGLALQLDAFRVLPVGLVETLKRGIGMTGAVLLGRLCFGEALGLPKVLGIALMTLGVALVLR